MTDAWVSTLIADGNAPADATHQFAVLIVSEGCLSFTELAEALQETGYWVASVSRPADAEEIIEQRPVHLVVAHDPDQGKTVTQLLDYMARESLRTPVVVVGDPPSVNGAVKVLQLGAHEYLNGDEGIGALFQAIDAACRRVARHAGPAPMEALTDSLRLTLADYQITRVIGQGNIGVVFQAWKEGEAEPLALKVLNPVGSAIKSGDSAELLERFINEAEAAASVDNRHVVKVYEYGIEPSELIPYLIMEYFPAKSLIDYMDAREQPDYAAEVEIIRQVAEALAAIHAAGICHRDIKPGNILVGDDGMVKLTDFGIALMPESDLTMPGQIIGSPAYLSPEGCRSSKIDARADIFSLGIVAYELTVARHPFAGDTVKEFIRRIQTASPPAPNRCVKDFPPALGAILARMLKKKPEARYQTADDLLADLTAFLKSEPGDVNFGRWFGTLFQRDWS